MPYSDPEKRKAYQAAYLAKYMLDPEHKDKARKASRENKARLSPEVRKQKWDAFYEKNKEEYKAKRRSGRDGEKEYIRENVAKHGITKEKVVELQGSGVCGICGDPPKEKRLCIDHDHNTGIVRGLLCHTCNTGLGMFRDSPDLMLKAIAYLAR